MSGGDSGQLLANIGPLYGIAALGVLPAFIGGLGLLARKDWAAQLIAFVSLLYLFAFPVGTAFGALGLWALLSPGGRSAPSDRRPLIGRDQINLLLVIVGTGLVLAIALAIALSVIPNGPPSSGPVYGPDGIPIPIPESALTTDTPFSQLIESPLFEIAVMIFAAILLVPALRNSLSRDRLRKRALTAHRQRWANRIAKLKADPLRESYAARVEAGEIWSDDQIDYDMDIEKVVTCIHLQPLEHAIRRAGIIVRLTSTNGVTAECRVDAAKLVERNLLTAPAFYQQYFQSERAREDNPTAELGCKACSSSHIYVLHPNEGGRSARTSGG